MASKKLLSLLVVVAACLAAAPVAPATPAVRTKALQAFKNGNYRDAYELFRKLTLDPKTDPKKVGDDLFYATRCLERLNRTSEIDDYREEVIRVHANNWRLLEAAAVSYAGERPRWGSITPYGYLVADKFYRGSHRGGGLWANAVARDRVRGLQLMVRAMKLARGQAAPRELARFYFAFARMIARYRGHSQAWRLQYLTDLSTLPDYDTRGFYYRYYYPGDKGAPVRPDGTPVYHKVPPSFEAAKTDGERWRWLLAQTAELDAKRTNEVRMILADFFRSQFGVQTMARYRGYFRPRWAEADAAGKKQKTGTFDLHTLGEDETIARLATGIRRFRLPDEFNFIKIYQQVVEDGDRRYGERALNSLARIFENRRQYDKAAAYWKRSIRQYGPGANRWKEKQVDQILGNWGMFEPVAVQPAGSGKGATVEFRFRNGRKVHFEAHAIKVDRLLEDVKAYIKSRPSRLDWRKVSIDNIGWRLVEKNQTRYLGPKVAAWDLELKPRPKHFDRRVTVTTPLQKAGAYLLKATMAGGNTTHIILWLNDTVILRKQLDGASYYYVADAVTGTPVAGAHLEFFGYRQKWVRRRTYRIDVQQFAEFADENGQVMPKKKDMPSDYRWLVIARTKGGRFAHLGFSYVWYGRHNRGRYRRERAFLITDRPVYRPRHTVRFKAWVRRADYDLGDVSQFAHREFLVRIYNPKSEKVFEKTFKTDAYGGLDGRYALPKDAVLGMYSIRILKDPRHPVGRAGFRVEEYKKPEFEVTVEAPEKPVMLGEKITATIKARYFFGAPVIKARVKYKVLRYNHTAVWYPVFFWDWFYGRGYWWFAYDYAWYPGWSEWGCRRPRFPWWGRAHNPPEVVMENEVPIRPDGTVRVVIDTSVAKEIHGDDMDHRYEITAEVTDESRRTIVGKGSVMVARRPFKVYAWLDRGYYRVGDTLRADFKAQTLDNRPVRGKGVLTLLRVTYDKNHKPVETPVQTWKLDTDDRGRATLQIKAHKAGQYRLSYKVTDAKGHTIEGGYIFVIRGEGFDGADYRFNDIEIIPDKPEYKPGEKVHLLINTNRVGSTVLLFVRPVNGVYRPPKVLRLKGKSTTWTLDVAKADMPNFFIEACTVSNGRLHTDVRQVVVPPEKRVLDVKVTASAAKYKPGEKATVTVKLTDRNGRPFVGSLVVAIYDKAVEYISGGTNVPEIKAFFWKWRRSHYPRTETNLSRWFRNLARSGVLTMRFLGAFGHSVADEDFDDARNRPVAEATKEKAETFGRAAGAPALAADRGVAGRRLARKANAKGGGGGGPAGTTVEPVVRKQFADTAYWAAALTTDRDGVATVTLTMPDNLTTWKIRAWGMGHGTRVGQGEAEVVTTKNLLLRLQAPRFFVEKDEVVLSANIHNYLKAKKTVEAVLELDGGCLQVIGPAKRKVAVAAAGEVRVDWRVRVLREGRAVVRMKALTDEESDAMQMTFPVYVHGMLKTESWSGALRPEDKTATITITVPKERRVNQSRLEIRYSPTLAGAMVDALPYLVDYPHKTSDCQLNRFLPTALVHKILLEMNLDLRAIREKRTNLNAQEIGDDKKRAAGWKRWKINPVFDPETVKDMVKSGVRHLTAMQLSDGGWGWFSGWGERSSAHTTALVVHGLQMAQEHRIALVPGVLQRGVRWLKNYQAEQVRRLQNAPRKKRPYKTQADNIDAFVFMVLVDAGVKDADMLRFLYRDRTKLAVYANAMFGLALHKLGEKEKLAMVVRNIDQYLVQDDENQTAYLNLPENNWWWFWYGSEYEAQAYYLKLLCRIDPKGVKASRLVKYLLNNRKHATYWNSPRDTAICVEAFAEYLLATGEHKPDLTVRILVDGKEMKTVRITAENLFTFDNKLVLVGDAVTTGKHTITIRKTGKGPLYFNAYLTTFTLEDPIRRAGLEIKVDRRYYKLVRVAKTIKVQGSRGQAVDQKVEKYERRPLKNLDVLKSGDLVEVELVVRSKNDYEYIVFEDLKPAGFEPVRVRSGYVATGLHAYMELRDERVCFFVRRLARGTHSVSYRMRAEIPGRFSAQPTRGAAMYAPELRANSDEIKLRIED